MPSQTATARSETGVAPKSTLLASHSIPLPAAFSFSCYGVRFEATVNEDPECAARLTVHGDLGNMPYSAESTAARRYLRAVVDAGKDLPHATITLSKTQSMAVRGAMAFVKHPSPAVVAAGASAIVLACKPVIELIEACRTMPAKG